MPHHPSLNIVPDLRGREYDEQNRMEEHFNIFGHLPPGDPNVPCRHPVHDQVTRLMNDATVAIHFNPEDVVSDDSGAAAEYQEMYDRIYQMTKDFQQQVKEEDQYERMKRVGLIRPN